MGDAMTAAQQGAFVIVDRRTSNRTEVDWDALGIFPGTDSTMQCSIVDVSDNGAKLNLGDVDILPSCFRLFLPVSKAIRECEEVWRNGCEIGVVFRNKVA